MMDEVGKQKERKKSENRKKEEESHSLMDSQCAAYCLMGLAEKLEKKGLTRQYPR